MNDARQLQSDILISVFKYQLQHGVLDQPGVAVIVGASGEPPQDAKLPVDLTQQQAARVGRDPPAVEPSPTSRLPRA